MLAAKDIHLVKLGSRTRCYIVGGSYEAFMSLALKEGMKEQHKDLSEKERCRLLDDVRTEFQRRTKQYWNGAWTLNEEISSIPQPLWKDYILQMASRRKLKSWHITAMAIGRQMKDVSPISNTHPVMPEPSMEDCLCDPRSDFSRSDLLLCVRTLKVIEQVVFARTHSIAGPLTVCLSISGIVELSPSFRSVENDLGLSLSYNKTEAYKLRSLSEREKGTRGAWENVPGLGDMSIPTSQFDNWDLLPLHAVKAEGKAMPKINGSLVQGVARNHKRRASLDTISHEAKPQKFEWKSASLLGDRDKFAEPFISPERKKIVNQFSDVVFGLVISHRDNLISYGEHLSMPNVHGPRPGITTESETHITGKSVINFRSLLLAAFKHHGGREQDDDELFKQHVDYVDISREPASDILTVRRILVLIRSLHTPGKTGCPRFVVVGGDQPSYKMTAEIWFSSWRESRSANRDASSRANLSEMPCTNG